MEDSFTLLWNEPNAANPDGGRFQHHVIENNNLSRTMEIANYELPGKSPSSPALHQLPEYFLICRAEVVLRDLFGSNPSNVVMLQCPRHALADLGVE